MNSLARVLLAALLCAAALSARQPPGRTHLVIVVDGLRPDYVTPEMMPRLAQLSRRGTVFSAHHSVFPTVTRVNAASFVTGTYPEGHGIMGNIIYIPKANATKTLDTGQRADLEAVVRGEGRLLTAPTLGEILHAAGRKMMAVSSGSSGSAWILNQAEPSAAIVHYDYAQPPALAARVAAVLGPAPPNAIPDDGRNQYAIDAYLKLGLDEVRPDVTFMWLHDPDGTAHANGIGVPITRQALALVDAGIGRIEDTLRSKGLLDRTNIIVTSDHGFSTHTGELKLAVLVQPFAKPMPDGSPDIIVAEGSIHFRNGPDPVRVQAIVKMLQQRPEVGAIFTRSPMAGTLSFEVARWNHPSRGGEILVSPNWSNRKNDAGFEGTTTNGGVAGHGSSSPFDIHNTLIAAGPDFREGATSAVPTGNVDIAPTLLKLVGLPVPASMHGRVIEEGLRSGPEPSSVQVIASGAGSGWSADGTYRVTASFHTAFGKRYLDATRVDR
jgi:predicted AlkP superfamily pyrophosphatase or phosphodiesterase